MHFRGGAAEVVEHRGDLGGLGQLGPVQVGLVRGQLAVHETDITELGVAEQRVGVGLQRPVGARNCAYSR